MYEGMEGAIRVALIDFILVFAILGLLALSMMGLHEIIKLMSRKKSVVEKNVVLEKDKMILESESQKAIATVEKEEDADGRLIAVISAAMSSYLEKPINQIKVIHIQRSMPVWASPWTIYGKQNFMSNRSLINSKNKGRVLNS